MYWYKDFGLCFFIQVLFNKHTITYDEHNYLYDLIKANPTYRYRHTGSLFYFKPKRKLLRYIYLWRLYLKVKWND